MHELIGKTILGIEIDLEKQFWMKFITNEGSIYYHTEGDCCSETWFYSISGVKELIGSTVLEVSDSEIPDDRRLVVETDGNSRDQEDTLYGYRIKTSSGWADVEFRNSSSGHYGGHIELWNPGPNYKYESTVIIDDWIA